jgi:hypothetical protein
MCHYFLILHICLLPSGMRWGTVSGRIAIYQFNLPVAGQANGIVSPGHQSAYPGDHFSWSIVAQH